MGSNPTVICLEFFFFQIEETCTLMDIPIEISSKCDIKAENRSTLCQLYEGRKGLGPMGSNADRPPSCLSLG